MVTPIAPAVKIGRETRTAGHSVSGCHDEHQLQIEDGARPGSVPAWAPDSAAAQPPARRGLFFQYLEPLKRRFIKWL
eukprot:7525492-Pyramimonas_sp.AAC.1